MKKRRKKIMAQIDPKDLKVLQSKGLDMLLYFKQFCDENNLLFYFCGGCCIGTIRHNGFIPWDDDLDVFMPRKDYERLKELWNKKADTDRYACVFANENLVDGNLMVTIRDCNTTLVKDYQENMNICHGISMDVFPLDGYPNSRLKRKLQMFWALIYMQYCAQIVPVNHGKLMSFIGKFMLALVPSKRVRYKIWRFAEKQMSKYPIEECENITELCAGPYYMKNKYPAKLFESAIYGEFEGYQLPIPVGYDEYLRIAFGDYMKLPPEEKRIAHNNMLFFDANNSYKIYRGKEYLKEEQK